MSWHQHLHNYTSAFYLLQTTLERPYAPLVVTWNKHSDQSQKRGTENNAAFVIANKARKTVTLAWVNKRPHNSRWLPPGPLPKIAAIVWKTGFNTCLSRQSCKQRYVFVNLRAWNNQSSLWCRIFTRCCFLLHILFQKVFDIISKCVVCSLTWFLNSEFWAQPESDSQVCFVRGVSSWGSLLMRLVRDGLHPIEHILHSHLSLTAIPHRQKIVLTLRVHMGRLKATISPRNKQTLYSLSYANFQKQQQSVQIWAVQSYTSIILETMRRARSARLAIKTHSGFYKSDITGDDGRVQPSYIRPYWKVHQTNQLELLDKGRLCLVQPTQGLHPWWPTPYDVLLSSLHSHVALLPQHHLGSLRCHHCHLPDCFPPLQHGHLPAGPAVQCHKQHVTLACTNQCIRCSPLGWRVMLGTFVVM